LTASIQHVVSADPVAIPVLQRFTSVRVHDSTTIGLPDALTTTWSGCGNDTGRGTAGLKCGVQLDLLTGGAVWPRPRRWACLGSGAAGPACSGARWLSPPGRFRIL
jgi:hypothetical protein